VGLTERSASGFIRTPLDLLSALVIDVPGEVATALAERGINFEDFFRGFIQGAGAPRVEHLQSSLAAGAIFYTPADLNEPCYRARLFTRACTGDYYLPADGKKIKVSRFIEHTSNKVILNPLFNIR